VVGFFILLKSPIFFFFYESTWIWDLNSPSVQGLVVSRYAPCNLWWIVNKSCHHEFEESVELDCQSLWQLLTAGISPLKVIWNTEFTSCCDILESKSLWQILEQCRWSKHVLHLMLVLLFSGGSKPTALNW